MAYDAHMHHEMTIAVNGSTHAVTTAPATMLSEVLREQLGLTSVKVACGRGECGACTVLIDGRPSMSCITPARLAGEVTTLEGLVEESADLREAFADFGGFQCGFCTPGQIVHATALLRTTLPTDPQLLREAIRCELAGNICRCTGYQLIVDAVISAVREVSR
jgi:aerobic-type carbon monoxide dehydrogenase small subunit (CoxS/CutS family)